VTADRRQWASGRSAPRISVTALGMTKRGSLRLRLG
jgi:hypothetical protein